METLEKEEEIKICSQCKVERGEYECECEKCGNESYPVSAVRQTISRVLLKK